jgi:hypothetical protein
MNKFFIITLFALVTLGASAANAQTCPNHEMFGTHPVLAVDRTVQAEIEVTYFTTDDPNVFLSERAGISRSGSFMRMDSNQFVAKIDGLKRDGVASIKKQQRATSYLGETAELYLERNTSGNDAHIANASMSSTNYLAKLDRLSDVSVYKERDSYRLSLLSWFVDPQANGGEKTVDYDANVFLKPGQTAVFKLMSSGEIKRTGAARSYMAVTMRSVNNGAVASLGR